MGIGSQYITSAGVVNIKINFMIGFCNFYVLLAPS